jgi:hypothetical protein
VLLLHGRESRGRHKAREGRESIGARWRVARLQGAMTDLGEKGVGLYRRVLRGCKWIERRWCLLGIEREERRMRRAPG